MRDSKVFGIMLCYMDGFVISVLEGRYLGCFVGGFHGSVDDAGGPFVGIVVGGIITCYEIYAMKFNDSSPVSCKT